MAYRHAAVLWVLGGICLLAGEVAGDLQVGAYYYPWYGDFSDGHRLTQSLRGHLVPQQPPAIGLYSNRAAETVEAHLDQSRQANIDFWALSWWGPSSAEDRTIREHLLSHERAGELRYAIHYESTGRFGPFDNPDFSPLLPDFRYLAENYFGREDYLHIDGRPVVFLYVTRAYFNTAASRAAVTQLREAIHSEFGLDLYLVGDDVFTPPVDQVRARLWDAITDFDVYGTALQAHGSTSQGLEALDAVYADAATTAESLGIGFIPTASPGFNDSGVRPGHPAAPRYLVDEAAVEEGSLFKRMLADVVVPRVDSRADEILMINSFNEWHEDTQIEPSVVAPPADRDDSSDQRYAQGYLYPGYGSLYLDLLREATAAGSVVPGDMNGDGRIDFDDVESFVLGLSEPQRYESLFGVPAAARGDLDGDGDLDFDDIPGFVDRLGAVVRGVPEPASGMLGLLAAIVTLRAARRPRGGWGEQPSARSSPAKRPDVSIDGRSRY